jgi:hypothetical protein
MSCSANFPKIIAIVPGFEIGVIIGLARRELELMSLIEEHNHGLF